MHAHTYSFRQQVALSAMRRAEEAKGEVAAAKGETVAVMKEVLAAKGEIATLKIDQVMMQVVLDKRTAELMRAQSSLSMRGVIGE